MVVSRFSWLVPDAKRRDTSSRPRKNGQRCQRCQRCRDDSGFTLTELLIASTLLVVLLTIVMISMSMVSEVANTVTTQYQEFDQALPALAPLQALLRAEVEPGPATAGGAPTPGFGYEGAAGTEPNANCPDSICGYSLVFYSDIGTAYNNVTSGGTTAGPAMIVAEELNSSGTPVNGTTTNPPQCPAASPCSFQVREYLPKQTNVNGVWYPTCPVLDTQIAQNTVNGQPPVPVTSGTTDVPVGPCQYRSTYALVANVYNVVNDPTSQPIFTYSVFDNASNGNGGTDNDTFVLLPSELSSGTINLVVNHSYPTGTPNVSLSTCSPPAIGYPACPADAIQSVGIDLQVQVKGQSQILDNQSVVYRYPEPSPNEPYPYQYSTSAG